MKKPIFLCYPNPFVLVSPFVDAVGNLATQSKAQMQTIFFQVEAAVKNRLACILETINQRRSHCVGVEAKEENNSTLSTNARKPIHWHAGTFWEIQQYIASFWIQQCKVRYQPYQEILTNSSRKRTRYWTDCYQKSKHFVSFTFGNVQFLDVFNLLWGATILYSFLKAYKASETEMVLPIWMVQPLS